MVLFKFQVEINMNKEPISTPIQSLVKYVILIFMYHSNLQDSYRYSEIENWSPKSKI